MLCSERHICHWDWESDPVPVVEVEPVLPTNSLHEGAVGPDGALWIGTMHQNIAEDDGPAEIAAATGRLYRYTAEGDLSQVTEDRFSITNTLVWSGVVSVSGGLSLSIVSGEGNGSGS